MEKLGETLPINNDYNHTTSPPPTKLTGQRTETLSNILNYDPFDRLRRRFPLSRFLGGKGRAPSKCIEKRERRQDVIDLPSSFVCTAIFFRRNVNPKGPTRRDGMNYSHPGFTYFSPSFLCQFTPRGKNWLFSKIRGRRL